MIYKKYLKIHFPRTKVRGFLFVNKYNKSVNKIFPSISNRYPAGIRS